MSRRDEDTGLARFAKSERRQRKIAEQLDTSWKKYARCSLCNHRYVCNNYPDRKARVNQDKIAGKIVCPWCKGRFGKFGVQLMLITERVAAMADGACGNDEDACKCLSHTAARVLKAHEEAPTIR